MFLKSDDNIFVAKKSSFVLQSSFLTFQKLFFDQLFKINVFVCLFVFFFFIHSWTTVHPQVLSAPELSRHLKKYIEKSIVFLVALWRFRHENHGAFCALITCTLCTMAYLGTRFSGAIIIYTMRKYNHPFFHLFLMLCNSVRVLISKFKILVNHSLRMKISVNWQTGEQLSYAQQLVWICARKQHELFWVTLSQWDEQHPQQEEEDFLFCKKLRFFEFL